MPLKILNRHHKASFTDQTITLDGTSYIGCKFTKCRVRYGGGLTDLQYNNFNSCSFEYFGAADRTVAFAKEMNIELHGGGLHLYEGKSTAR